MPSRESGHVLIGQNKIAYSIRRSVRRRRSIGLLVGREGEIRILAPARAGLAAIERLILRQSSWIGKRLENVNRRRELYPTLRFEPGENIAYRGEGLVLRVTEFSDWPQGCVIEGGALVVNLPNVGARGENPTPDPALPPTLFELRRDQSGPRRSLLAKAGKGRGTLEAVTALDRREEVRLEIMLWYKKQARQVFRERVDVWGEITGLHPRRLVVGNARRQWGSCSAANDVRLNWRLITAAPPLLDYVIVHELCHIAHKNHSARFWALVEKFVPDWKARRKELRGMDAGGGE